MNPEWRMTSKYKIRQGRINRQTYEHGDPTLRHNLEDQRRALKDITLDIRPFSGIGGKKDHGFKNAAYIFNNQTKFQAAGIDQFSALFNTVVVTGAPDVIKQSELDFGVLAEGAKDEYLALAQKARLFYQDPAILNL